MNPLTIPAVPAVLAVAVIIVLCTHCSPQVAMAQQHTPVTASRLYTGADGLTHVEQMNVKFSPVLGDQATVEESEPVKVTSAYIVRAAAGFFGSWHNAGKRRYVVTISGRAEIEIANGQKITLEPGQLALAEDLTGKGHTFRVLGTNDWVALFVDFAP
jgi:hypothetical protein